MTLLEYFNGGEIEADVFLNKYALKDNEGNVLDKTPDDMHRRIAKELHRIEKKYPNPLSAEIIYEKLKNFSELIPQGSPMSAIGNPYQLLSLSNCFVTGNNEDSYGGILNTDQELVQLMKRRAGVGVDISHIRPEGSKVDNAVPIVTGKQFDKERS